MPTKHKSIGLFSGKHIRPSPAPPSSPAPQHRGPRAKSATVRRSESKNQPVIPESPKQMRPQSAGPLKDLSPDTRLQLLKMYLERGLEQATQSCRPNNCSYTSRHPPPPPGATGTAHGGANKKKPNGKRKKGNKSA